MENTHFFDMDRAGKIMWVFILTIGIFMVVVLSIREAIKELPPPPEPLYYQLEMDPEF